MFDPQKPYDSLPLLPTGFNYEQVQLLKQVNKSNIALAKLNIRAEKIPNSLLLVSPLLVRESVASSGIENINTTTLEVFEAEIKPEKERSGPAKEVLHYRDAMQYGLGIIKKKNTLNLHDLEKIQAMIEPEKKGFRTAQVRIADFISKKVLYTPPSSQALPKLLENLEEFINDTRLDIDPLIRMAVIHHQFESIHPFLDGNGRVGRILMILYLVMMGRLHPPILFISGYILENRKSYYDHLRESNETGDLTSIIMFLLKAIELQSMQTEITIKKIEDLMGKCQVIMDGKLKGYKSNLLSCVFSRPFLTIDYAQHYLKLSSRQTASKYLSSLSKLGLLKEQRAGNQKFFYSREFLQLLS